MLSMMAACVLGTHRQVQHLNVFWEISTGLSVFRYRLSEISATSFQGFCVDFFQTG